MADVVVINKIDSADFENILKVRENIAQVNPAAVVIDAASTISVEKPEVIRGKRILVIEDGPTLTHGEAKIGAGIVAAKRFGASEIIDPRQYAVGKLTETYKKYPNIINVLPAMGYGEEQTRDLEATIEAASAYCDSVVIATPIDLNRVIKINKPNTQVHYALQEIGKPDMEDILTDFINKVNSKSSGTN